MFIESLEGRQMFSASAPAPAPALFEVEDYSFDIEQVLNIGSQSSGAGAGKVTFNPVQITAKAGSTSPTLVQKA